MVRHIAASTTPARRPLALLRLLSGSKAVMAATAAVCEAATTLAARLAVGPDTIADLDVYYERWDGKGLPGNASGEQVTRPAQAVQVAEAVNAFLQVEGADAAVAFVGAHSGRIFAPAAAEAFLSAPGEIVARLDAESLWDVAVARGTEPLDDAQLDTVCEVLADFADLRSVYLGGHSRGVARLAAEAARLAHLPETAVATVRRAALVHDVGRVAVSAGVWGKAGSLTRSEWEQVRLHPYHAERVLARPERLAELGRIASFHHERVDGSGYFRGARELTREARLLAAADTLHAMREKRPHRAALSLDKATTELRSEVRAGRLDGDAAECVVAAAGATPRRPEAVGGLSAREVEVLRLIAQGLTKKQVARELVIAPKTADAHVQHIYAKLGVSTRAGATLFAMQHGLLDTLAS
jgi:HD-GYP domain-containing protein (c-di-GMP phosphodiesterase class II)